MPLKITLSVYTTTLAFSTSLHLFWNIQYTPQFSWVFLFSRPPLLGSLCPTLEKCSSCSCGENLFPDECDPCLWRHVLPLSCRLKKPLDFSILSPFLPLHSFTFHLPHSIYLLSSLSRKKLHSLQRILYFFLRRVLKRDNRASSTFLTIFRFHYNTNWKKSYMVKTGFLSRHFHVLEERRKSLQIESKCKLTQCFFSVAKRRYTGK